MKMQKYEEAEKALKLPEDFKAVGGAPGLYLLGTIIERQARQREAIVLYKKALELDPTLWIAFEKLCKLEPKIRIESLFKDDHPAIIALNTAVSQREHLNRGNSTITGNLN